MRAASHDVWIVGDEGTSDCYVFEREEDAVWFRTRRGVWHMTQGSQPLDGGNLFITPEEREDILKREPGLAKFIRQVYGSREFIHGIERYCFWLVDATPEDIKRSKILYGRVEKVRNFRLSCKSKSTQKIADRPSLFNSNRQPSTEYLLIPRHSSGERMYVPMGYVSPDIIATDAVFVLPNATPYHFAVLTSRVHMGWMRRYAGRLRMDYRYSVNIIYNNFIWPESDPHQVIDIERTGKKILEVRARHPKSSLSSLYDEISMPPDLRKAHRDNDAAVMEAYGLPPGLREDETVDRITEMYQEFIRTKLGEEC